MDGLLVEVTEEPLGSQAVAVVAVGVIQVPVEDITHFPGEGGVIDILGVRYDYTSVVPAAPILDAMGDMSGGGTLVLATPVTTQVDEDDPVRLVVGTQVATNAVAVIDIPAGEAGDSPDGGDPVHVILNYEQRPVFPVGVYDPPLPVYVADDLSAVMAVPGVVPAVDSSMLTPITGHLIQTEEAVDRGIKLDADGFHVFNSVGDETVTITPSGEVTITGDLRTSPVGQSRVELTDYVIQNDLGDISSSGQQLRFIPADSIPGWDLTQPGFMTHWSYTDSSSQARFITEIVTADPSATGDRGRIRIASGSQTTNGHPRSSTILYGDTSVWDRYGGVRVLSITNSELTHSMTDDPEAFLRANKSEFVWSGGALNTYLWAQSTALQWQTNGRRELFVGQTSVVMQTNNGTGPSSSHAAGFLGNDTRTIAGYWTEDLAAVHGFMTLSGGSLRMCSRESGTASIEAVTGQMDAYRSIMASAFNVASDRSAKENLRAPEFSALAVLRDAPVYAYDYKTDVVDDDRVRLGRIGVMADDLPDAVASPTGTTSDLFGGELQALDLAQMVGVLTLAVQELDAELDAIRGSKPNRRTREFTGRALPTKRMQVPVRVEPADRPAKNPPPNRKNDPPRKETK